MKLKVWLLTAFFIFCTLAGAAMAPSFALAEGETVDMIKIDVIRIEGNQRVPLADITAKMKLRPGDTADKEKIKADCEAILTLGKLSEVRPDVRFEDGKVVLAIKVTENPVITAIVFEGNFVIGRDALLAVMITKPGEMLDTAQLRRDITAIEKLYQDAGFVLARVVDVNISQAGVVTLTIAEGIVEDIRVEGLQKTKPFVITRELLLKPGDVFEREKLRKSLQKVFNLGFFEDVSSRVEPGTKPGQVILVIKVVERKTGMASAGLGYSSKDGLVGSVEVSDANFRGVGQKVQARFEFGTKQSYELTFREPWLDRRNTSLEVSLYDTTKERFRETDDKLTETRKGGRLTLGRPLGEAMSAFMTYKAEDVSISEDLSIEDGPIRSLEAGLVRDTRDVFANPTSGSRTSLSIEKAGSFLGGEFNFDKYNLDTRRYVKLSRQNHVLALRLNLGLGTGNIPLYEKYSLGGAFNLRGYEEDEFVGDNILAATAEYRVPVNKSLSAVGFVDAGKIWDAEATGSDLKLGYGVGVRVDTPIGPIRLDYGIGDAGGRIHFSIGQMF